MGSREKRENGRFALMPFSLFSPTAGTVEKQQFTKSTKL